MSLMNSRSSQRLQARIIHLSAPPLPQRELIGSDLASVLLRFLQLNHNLPGSMYLSTAHYYL